MIDCTFCTDPAKGLNEDADPTCGEDDCGGPVVAPLPAEEGSTGA